MSFEADERIESLGPRHPHARYCLGQYFDELDRRFEAGFDTGLGTGDDDTELRPPEGELLVAVIGDEPVGCVAIRYPGDDAAEIKRMWVAPSARGRGLARRMLAAAEETLARAGATVVQLDTNRVLDEAIRLYRSAGYREIERYNDNPYAHHWFEKDLDPPG